MTKPKPEPQYPAVPEEEAAAIDRAAGVTPKAAKSVNNPKTPWRTFTKNYFRKRRNP